MLVTNQSKESKVGLCILLRIRWILMTNWTKVIHMLCCFFGDILLLFELHVELIIGIVLFNFVVCHHLELKLRLRGPLVACMNIEDLITLLHPIVLLYDRVLNDLRFLFLLFVQFEGLGYALSPHSCFAFFTFLLLNCPLILLLLLMRHFIIFLKKSDSVLLSVNATFFKHTQY